MENKSLIKTKQIVVRFDIPSYNKIVKRAEKEHRGFGEFVRHAVLVYIENAEVHKPENLNNFKQEAICND